MPYSPPTYFPPSYFAPGYFGGATATPPNPGVASPGYFPADYFAPAYFPGSYFPHPTAGPTLPASFLAAIYAALRADATLRAMVPGGFWHREAQPGRKMPYVVYRILAISRQDSTSSGDWIETGQLQVVTYSTRPDVASRIADRISVDLTDSALAWTIGRNFYLRPVDPSSPAPPAAGPGAARITPENRQYQFRNSGNYADHA